MAVARGSAEALFAASAAADGISQMLTGEEEGAATGPDGSTSPGLITQAAAELHAIAGRLRDIAPLADGRGRRAATCPASAHPHPADHDRGGAGQHRRVLARVTVVGDDVSCGVDAEKVTRARAGRGDRLRDG